MDAARRGDAPAASALVSDRDETFAARTRVWAANLGRIDWSVMTWTVRPRQAVLAPERRTELGPTAWTQEVAITWSLPGADRRAQESIWLTFGENDTDGGAATHPVQLVGDTDDPGGPRATPLWLTQPVQLYRTDDVLLLTDVPDPTAWLEIAASARTQAVRRVGSAGTDLRTPLVVEIPQSRTAFERVLGVPANSYATVAAAAWPRGPDARTAPLHIVVSPEPSRRLSRLGRDVLLTHEAVHVLTRSPASPAPTWLVEGYADQVAYDAYPSARAPALSDVRDEAQDGVPTGWPAEADFAPAAHDLDLAYRLAWSAARSIARAEGQQGLNRLYAAVDRGATIEEAAAELGTTEAALLRGWRAELTRLADR